MPLFYFHVSNGQGFVEDEEGAELADADSARQHAVEGLRDIMAGEMKRGEMNLGSFIEVEDENHELLMTVSFVEAVRVSSDPAPRPRK